jgi:gamma-glutamyltranspeptidase/glutathione hydrolase
MAERSLKTRLVSLGIGLALLAPAKQPVAGTHGMVVAQEPIAADTGLATLKAGGNAVDAAVATAFALAVTHPVAGNLGGGGFMLIRMANGQTAFFDFREAAPKRATRDMYLGQDGSVTKDSIYGWRSSGVPGTVAGLAEAHHTFGSKPWAGLVHPAVTLARDGIGLTEPVAASFRSAEVLAKDPESKRIFQRDGHFYAAGERLVQPELASTLERIEQHGRAGFYGGETAEKFAAEMAAHGGLITLEDLQTYSVKRREPLTGSYHGYDIVTTPPPSAGGIGVLQMLAMLDGTGFASDGPDSAKAVHYEAEVMRRFYADRSQYLGDPDFYNVPLRALLAPPYIEKRRASIDPVHASSSEIVGPGLPAGVNARLTSYESDQTTHFNVVDSQGNAVAMTYTLNNSYGNGITVPGLGFLLNDEMDDFVAKPGTPNMFGLVGGDANAIEPGKRPLSSMTPVIVTKSGKPVLLLGAPGGSRITTGVFQVLLDILDFHLNVQDAVDLPRFHHQWKPDVLYLQDGFDASVKAQLHTVGYDVRPIEGVARVEAIAVRSDGQLQGGTESRLHGKVSAY